MCKYVERLNNGDVDQMIYKHYGKLYKHSKQSRSYWKENISNAVRLWNDTPLAEPIRDVYKDLRTKYELNTSSFLLNKIAFERWCASKFVHGNKW